MLWTVLSAQPCTLPRIGANQHHRQASEYQAGNKQPLGPAPLVLEAAHTQPLHKAERQGQATIQRSSQPQRPTGRDILLHEQPFRLLSRPRVANAGGASLYLVRRRTSFLPTAWAVYQVLARIRIGGVSLLERVRVVTPGGQTRADIEGEAGGAVRRAAVPRVQLDNGLFTIGV